MRRILLGEESRFVESLLGRITVILLFTAICGVVLALIFLINQFVPPVALKYTALMALGLAAGFMSRRLLAGRNRLLRFFSAIFAVLVALDLLSLLTHRFLGLNLLRGNLMATPLDTGLQLLVPTLGVLLAQRAWLGARRQVMVEPRFSEEPAPPARPRRPARTTRVNFSSLSATLNRSWNSAVAWTQSALGNAAGAVRTRRKVRQPVRHQAPRKRRGEIALSADEEHVCPYCLEPVFRRDPRGVKICRVCKTWHHADCWDITGVCQVPHQYVS